MNYVELRKAEDKQFILRPMNWPAWPWLPVINENQWGCLHADEPYPDKPLKVYLVSIFRIDTYFPHEEMKFLEYQSIDEMLNAGWRVD